MAKKPTLQYQPGEGHRAPCHFFASSAAACRTGDNLDEVIAHMKKDGYPFNCWKVPGDQRAEYQIRNYAPDVEGCTFLGFWSS